MINVLTPAFYNILRDEKNVPEDKMIMIPNAADFDISENILKNFNRDLFRKEKGWSDKFIIIYVGAHGLANGLHNLIQAAELLQDTEAHFVLVGQGMQKKKLEELVKSKNITNVEFFDPIPKKEVFKFIISSEMGASILLKKDTFKTVYSNKTFDYMACKIPILMGIDGISRTLIEEADAGICAEPENSKDFARVIKLCLLNRNELKQKGENGYNFAKSNFDRTYLADKYLQWIEEKVTKV